MINRQEKIKNILEKELEINISKLAKIFKVTEMTIRRDLKHLERRGTVILTKGLVKINRGNIFQLEYLERMKKNLKEKIAIANKSLEFISNENTIFICHGTTTYQLAKLLRNLDINLKVITNALDTAMELAASDKIDSYIHGGYVNKSYNVCDLDGSEVNKNDHLIDVMFTGGDGIDIEYGLTSFNQSDSLLYKRIIPNVRKVIALIDSSKFGIVRYEKLVTLDKISVLITDSKISKETIKEYEKKNIIIIVAT